MPDVRLDIIVQILRSSFVVKYSYIASNKRGIQTLLRHLKDMVVLASIFRTPDVRLDIMVQILRSSIVVKHSYIASKKRGI